jgi:hypothetical protein
VADRIILTKLDDEADDILDRFQEHTGLDDVEDHDDRRIFLIEGEEHGIDVVHVLTAIDEHWPVHVGLQDPD